MDKRVLSILGIIIVAIAVSVGAYLYVQQDSESQPENASEASSSAAENTSGGGQDGDIDPSMHISEKDVTINVSSPGRGSSVSSPLQVTGQIPGSWSHEGEFTLRLLDGDSATLAESSAKLDGDWMTEDMVSFTANLTFDAPEPGSMGLLVLEKANPSDLEENSDSVTIQILF